MSANLKTSHITIHSYFEHLGKKSFGEIIRQLLLRGNYLLDWTMQGRLLHPTGPCQILLSYIFTNPRHISDIFPHLLK